MFYDVALIYDPETRRADLDIGEDGDLVIDETPITAVLLSVGLDRRANPDDPLPEGRSQFLTEAGIDVRRGASADALDPAGERIGSRCWLLDRAKATEITRLLYHGWLEESLTWVGRELQTSAEIETEWVAPQMLAWRVLVDDTLVSGRRNA
nr:phage GP46 family protein [Brucella anthropi]